MAQKSTFYLENKNSETTFVSSTFFGPSQSHLKVTLKVAPMSTKGQPSQQPKVIQRSTKVNQR